MSDIGLGKIITTACERDAIHIAVAPVTAAEHLVPGQPIGFPNAWDTESAGVVDEPIGIVDPFLKEAVLPGQRFWMFLMPNTITSLRHEWVHPAFVEVRPAPQASSLPPSSPSTPGIGWRTPTVLGICQQMRDSEDYSALPVLADALEDAGFTDADVLAECRKSHRGEVAEIAALRLISLVESDKAAESVKQIELIAEELDMTYNALMEAAERWVYQKDATTQYGSDHWRDHFNASMAERFWRHYEAVNEKEVEDKGARFFSCSC